MSSIKLQTDISFISSFKEFCQSHKWRMVVYGGYGLDGYIKRITREHGDIDLVVYGQTDRKKVPAMIIAYIKLLYPNARIIKKENPFQMEIDVNDHGFGLNLYYVQTKEDPHINLSTVVKSDGSVVINDPQAFPLPEKGRLENLEVEVQNQSDHLKDILNKGGANKPKYILDLNLLNTI